ncbi:MAG: hypothetical protein ACI9MX_002757 [Candidatus Aldehydirespiratoraceae bacterium]|jgi:hypothetical protein
MFGSVMELGQVEEALDQLVVADLSVSTARDAARLLRRLESVARRVRSVQMDVQQEVDQSGVYASDGHPSAKVMVCHNARLSPAAAANRDRGARMARGLPLVDDALRRGVLGIDYFDLLGRVWSNPRVRIHMADAQEWFLRVAARLSFSDFEIEVRTWERLADEDGPEPKKARDHEQRDVSLRQDPVELGWELGGGFGAMQGDQVDEILGHYADAERLADWEKAKAERGEAATAADLPRTEQQRRADALWQICQDAAANPGSACPEIINNIVWDAATIEEMARRFSGESPSPIDPTTSVCRSLNGTPLDPTEAFANALVTKMRRVVVDAAGVVIDMGRARFFTGGARLAAQMSSYHCPWPGCTVPTTKCEVDHTLDHAKGGRTNPGNGGPFCGKHNRWKQKGFALWRDPVGVWHTYRPDGSEI